VRSIKGEFVAVAIGFVAFFAPILLSLQLAWNQSIADEKEQNQRYASEVMRRADETAQQFGRATALLEHDHFARCSPQEIELMREIDVGSSFIQMVARISGNTIECTSLGTVTPIDAGRPTLITDNGVNERLDFKWGPQQLDRLDLIDQNGVAILVDARLLIDMALEGDDVGLAVTVPSSQGHQRLVEPKGTFNSNWFNPVDRGQTISSVEGQFIVSHVRSKTFDLEVISVTPLHYAYHRVRQFAVVFVPVGLVCGIGLSLVVMQIARTRSSLRGLLRAAARNKDFYVEYQPVVDLSTRHILGAEALVRWKRGDTVISPASFIQLAEESGVISLITQNVMDIVARDLPRLMKLNPEFHVAINLSATDLKSRATIDRLIELLRRSGASPRNLLVEATEHGLVTGPESREVMAGIRDLGICIALDDFGTGYSSLLSLQSLGLDQLKIDKAFVDTIGTDGATSHVVQHIIEMARSLNLQTVAEGVETEQQAAFLKIRKVAMAQGWLFGKPMSINSLCEKVISGKNQIDQAKPALSIMPG
jgi:sensor c-di-GMP phosphodiesterase-like protein